MFTKQEIKDRWFKERDEALAAGKEPPEAGVSLALLILSSSLFHKKTWSGEDYTPHPIHVGFNNTRSTTKQIIGYLHDVLEDSDWELEDLRELGFSQRILRALDGMTKRENENYFEFIERCGTSGDDAIDKKIEDLEHNSTNTRSPHIVESPHAALKRDAYNVCYFYLVAIKKGDIEPSTRVVDFMATRPEYAGHPARANELLAYFSDKPDRLPEPKTELAQAFKQS